MAVAGVYRQKRVKGIMVSLVWYATMIHAELISMEAVLAHFAIREGGLQRVLLHYDSLVAVKRLQNITTESSLTLEYFNMLHSPTKERSVEFH